MGLYDSMAPFAPLAETVVVRAFAPGSADIVSASVRAVVHVGQGLTANNGATIHQETGDGYTVWIAREAWPFPFPPALGHKFKLEDFGETVAKSAVPMPNGWNVKCVADMRAEPRG